MSKEVGAGGRFNIFLDSEFSEAWKTLLYDLIFANTVNASFNYMFFQRMYKLRSPQLLKNYLILTIKRPNFI